MSDMGRRRCRWRHCGTVVGLPHLTPPGRRASRRGATHRRGLLGLPPLPQRLPWPRVSTRRL